MKDWIYKIAVVWRLITAIDLLHPKESLGFMSPRLCNGTLDCREPPVGFKLGWARARPGDCTQEALHIDSWSKKSSSDFPLLRSIQIWAEDTCLLSGGLQTRRLLGETVSPPPFEVIFIMSPNLSSYWCLPFSKWNSGAPLTSFQSWAQAVELTWSWKGEFGQLQLGHFEHIC